MMKCVSFAMSHGRPVTNRNLVVCRTLADLPGTYLKLNTRGFEFTRLIGYEQRIPALQPEGWRPQRQQPLSRSMQSQSHTAHGCLPHVPAPYHRQPLAYQSTRARACRQRQGCSSHAGTRQLHCRAVAGDTAESSCNCSRPAQPRAFPQPQVARVSPTLCNLGVVMAALPAVLLGGRGIGGPGGPADGSGGGGDGGGSNHRHLLDLAEQPDDQDLEDFE